MKIALGYFPYYKDLSFEKERLKFLLPYKNQLFDLHFSHYDPQLVPSGRSGRYIEPETYFKFIEEANSLGFPLTLLLNNIHHTRLAEVVESFSKEFYPRGVKNVVVADLNLIRRLKDRFPDLYIQGSVLSFRMTEEELEEEAKAGVSLHNPRAEIIRNSEQLKKNVYAGYKQKIIWAEGCLNYCPQEKTHRLRIANRKKNISYCRSAVAKNILLFFKANWVTIHRLQELKEYIDVYKLTRNIYERKLIPSKIITPETVGLTQFINFIEDFEKNREHDVIKYLVAEYAPIIKKKFNELPSSLFTSEFFNAIESCRLDCKQRDCFICHDIIRKARNKRRRHFLLP